jgi:hypothetical protein
MTRLDQLARRLLLLAGLLAIGVAGMLPLIAAAAVAWWLPLAAVLPDTAGMLVAICLLADAVANLAPAPKTTGDLTSTAPRLVPIRAAEPMRPPHRPPAL